MLAKVGKPATACREANSNVDTINIRGDINSFRDVINVQQGRQQQQARIHIVKKVSDFPVPGWE
jgi:hypothetical protein